MNKATASAWAAGTKKEDISESDYLKGVAIRAEAQDHWSLDKLVKFR